MLTTLRNMLIGLCVIGMSSTALAQDQEQGDLEYSGDESSGEQAEVGGGGKPISVGLLLGYSLSLEDGPNPFGVGLGVRGGYNLDAIFLGARFVYYLGESNFNIWELGIEGGYDIAAGPVVIRPGLGLGIANLTVEIPRFAGFGGGSVSSTEVYFAPGASVLYDINDAFFIGGELRFMFVLSDPTYKALSILANGGMRF